MALHDEAYGSFVEGQDVYAFGIGQLGNYSSCLYNRTPKVKSPVLLSGIRPVAPSVGEAVIYILSSWKRSNCENLELFHMLSLENSFSGVSLVTRCCRLVCCMVQTTATAFDGEL